MAQKTSLYKRLIFTGILVSLIFLGGIGLVIERAFERAIEQSVHQRLQVYIYALISAVEMSTEGQLFVPENLSEIRLNDPDSGLYANIYIHSRDKTWTSPSSSGLEIPTPKTLKAGELMFSQTKTSTDKPIFAMSYGVIWELEDAEERAYTFTVAEEKEVALATFYEFRTMLWSAFLLAGITLILILLMLLRWVLQPLKRVIMQLQRVETGETELLEGDYPKELNLLVDSLNHLLQYEQRERERYRNSLADLAHSLKTPLAVLMSYAETHTDKESTKSIKEHIDRMNQIITHQLQRASASGKAIFKRYISVDSVVKRMVSALEKVYIDKQVSCFTNLSKNARFYGDEADLMECMGNVLENAFKYCHRQVSVTADTLIRNNERVLQIIIEDDGPGIPEAKEKTVSVRGVRFDEEKEGQGIGLDMALEVVKAYDGRVTVSASGLGGAKFCLEFPKKL